MKPWSAGAVVPTNGAWDDYAVRVWWTSTTTLTLETFDLYRDRWL